VPALPGLGVSQTSLGIKIPQFVEQFGELQMSSVQYNSLGPVTHFVVMLRPFIYCILPHFVANCDVFAQIGVFLPNMTSI